MINPTPINFIEVVNNSQIEKVKQLAEQIWIEYYTPIIGTEQVSYMLENFQSTRAIFEQIKTGMRYDIITHSQLPIGYYAIQVKNKAQSVKISKIYLQQQHRRLGYGRKAMEQIERLCQTLQIKCIELTVNRHNHAAIAFYLRMGFNNEGSIVQDIGSDFVMDDYRLVKRLICH